jgi:hypothetical protein
MRILCALTALVLLALANAPLRAATASAQTTAIFIGPAVIGNATTHEGNN